MSRKFLLMMTAFLFSVACDGLLAQGAYMVRRLTESVNFDGIPDEPAWDGCPAFPMVQNMPRFGDPATERTEIFMAYDDRYLYLAGRLYTSRKEYIRSVSKKRDFFSANTDWFGLILDTFNDKENGVCFFTNPAGLRLDVTVFNDAQGEMPVNLSWNTFWDVKTRVRDDGWFAEIRIPFSSLRFQEKDGRTVMGVIVWRWMAAKEEYLTCPPIPQKYGDWGPWKPSLAAEIILEGVQPRRPLYITPYALTGYGLSNGLNDDETAYVRDEDFEFEAGLDLKAGLSSNLTMDLTVNTDFAQVEADDQMVNLTRFSLFFPEKRLFFQERSSNFDFSLGKDDRLFYSRRIGIDEDRPVRIYGGGRLVGRLGEWDLGFLDMQTAPSENLSSENSGVLRIRRRVFNPHSYAGAMVTSRLGTNGTYNIAYGLDGIFRLFGDDYLQAYWAETFEDSAANRPFSWDPARIGLTWQRRTIEGIGYTFDLSRSGKDFNPGIGFVWREDFTYLGTELLYGWIPKSHPTLMRHKTYCKASIYLKNGAYSAESMELSPGWGFVTQSMWYAALAPVYYYEAVPDSFSLSDDVSIPPGEYGYFGCHVECSTPGGGKLYSVFQCDAGEFYDGWRVSVSAQPAWNILSDLELSGYYEYNHIVFPDRGLSMNAHIGRVKLLWTFSTAFSAASYIQYSNLAHLTVINFRLRYNPKEGNDLYLVYDEVVNDGLDRDIPVRPRTAGRTVLLKYSYTFQMQRLF